MGASLADAEGDHLARLELAPALRRAQLGASGDHDDELLLGHVPVVGVGRLTGWDLEQAEPDLLGADLTADASAQA